MNKVYLTPKDNLNEAFKNLSENTTVYLEKGTYYGKVNLFTSNVKIIGSGADTVISHNDYARMVNSDGVEIGTFQTYTLLITGDNVTLENLTVENTAGSPATLGQEVALSCYGNNFTAKNCHFKSTQDTLFLGPLPDDLVVRYDGFLPDYLRYYQGKTYQKFIDCTIFGTVDFIFGSANALFDNCKIVSLNDNRDVGYVAAPSHSLANEIGFVFLNCDLISNNAPNVYLARPWRDFGKTTFIDCNYQDHINPIGFINWQDTYREKTARFLEYNQKDYTRPTWTKKLSRNEKDEFLAHALKFFTF